MGHDTCNLCCIYNLIHKYYSISMLNKKKMQQQTNKIKKKTTKNKKNKQTQKNNLQIHQVWSDKYSVLEYKWFLVLMKILAGTSILILLIVALLSPGKGHLLNETFATVATNLSLVWQDTTGIWWFAT